jgi:hypothetical protein
VIVDGWNLILGAKKAASSREGLVAAAKRRLAERPDDFVWIVFDGPRANSVQEGRLRITYTGGEGAQRTDRFVCDFLRMANVAGCGGRVEVATNDRRFAAEAAKIRGENLRLT